MTSDFQYVRDEVLLRVENLSVSYAAPILRDVSFEVRDVKRPGMAQGQKVALLAPSGMGKTQLFKRIAGLEPPTSGRVLVGSAQLPVRAGMVGVVPQNYLLFEHRTVESSLLLAASMREPDRTKARARVAELLEEFQLADKRRFYPAELSGGQRQRISIAEQLLSSDHFLLMDEPFSGLDILMKRIVQGVIDQVARRDELNTIIFSTHDVESAVAVADTLLLLGRDRDEAGLPVPGARIQVSIDLVERNLAWHPSVEHVPGFAETVAEVKAMFGRL